MAAFAEDKWSPRPWLTLDAGLRVDRDAIASEVAVAPRLGVVLLPFGHTNTVLRGGVGLFYSNVPLNWSLFDSL